MSSVPPSCEFLKMHAPDSWHALVKMHVSFLLDLSTDDCPCPGLYDTTAAGPGQQQHSTPAAAAKKKLARFTPRRFLSHGSSSTSSGVMDGATLTQEGVCQVFQLIQFLSREYNIGTEGLFRKSGNLKKQQALKEQLNRGQVIDLETGDYSVHECAAVLKSFLSEMSEPLLTDAYYKAHCQAAQLVKKTMNDEEVAAANEKRMQCLQLLFLLLPEANFNLLKDLLFFLKKVADHESSNKMSASNLAIMFAPLILCPRKLSAESLQSNYQLLTKAISFMIEHAEHLFKLPPQLVKDAEIQSQAMKKQKVPVTATINTAKGKPQSPVVNTIYSFVDRSKTTVCAQQQTTEQALAALYAHVHSMPESAQKKRLVAKLNDANGHGTPGFRRKGGGETLKNFLTPRRPGGGAGLGPGHKGGRSNGSYSFKTPADPSQVLHSFKKNDEEDNNQKLLSPQSSPAILVSPAAIDSIVKKNQQQKRENLDGSYAAPDTPQTLTPAAATAKKAPPPVPLRVSSLDKTPAAGAELTVDDVSPITTCTKKMTGDMQKSMMTPRSRKPVLAVSKPHLDEHKLGNVVQNFIPEESPCVPTMYNEDEPVQVEEKEPATEAQKQATESVDDMEPQTREDGNEDNSDDENVDCNETDSYFEQFDENEREEVDAKDTFTVMDTPGVSREREISEVTLKTRAYTTSSLKKHFKEYLDANDMEVVDSSKLDCSVSSSVISNEARMLLNGEIGLSDSMYAVLNGEVPPEDMASPAPPPLPASDPPQVDPSVLDPVDVDSFLHLSDIQEGSEDAVEKENNGSFVSARSRLSNEIPLPVASDTAAKVSVKKLVVGEPASDEREESSSPIRSSDDEHVKKSRKRRSLTEISELNPMSQQNKAAATKSKKNNIYFETDL